MYSGKIVVCVYLYVYSVYSRMQVSKGLPTRGSGHSHLYDPGSLMHLAFVPQGNGRLRHSLRSVMDYLTCTTILSKNTL